MGVGPSRRAAGLCLRQVVQRQTERGGDLVSQGDSTYTRLGHACSGLLEANSWCQQQQLKYVRHYILISTISDCLCLGNEAGIQPITENTNTPRKCASRDSRDSLEGRSYYKL